VTVIVSGLLLVSVPDVPVTVSV